MKRIEQKKLDLLIKNHNLYMDSINKMNINGKKLILDEIDFSDNDLSQLNFVDVHITDSIFKNTIFNNVNFGGSKLYSCEFNNVTFKNTNFGKTQLDSSTIINSTFNNCTLVKVNSNDAFFKDLCFENCKLHDVFSYSIVKNILFEECEFNGAEFWECIISNLEFRNSRFEIVDVIKRINKGTLEQPLIINGDEAIEFFKDISKFA